MQIAQRLYQGIDIEGETTGLITYMRTDGTNMSKGGYNRISEKELRKTTVIEFLTGKSKQLCW